MALICHWSPLVFFPETQLELRLAKKDGAIEALESQVHLMRSGASTAFSSEAAPDDSLVPATPTQVSDESGETAGPDDGPGSHSPAISLSRISRVPSWDTEASPPAAADVGADADAAGVDGRWNIPFDASFDDELVPRSPPGSSAAFAPGSSAFVPIGGLGLAPRLGEGRRRSAGTASPLRRPAPRGCGTASPLAPRAVRPAHKGAARRSFGAAARDKENVSPRRSSAGTVIDVGAYRVVR